METNYFLIKNFKAIQVTKLQNLISNMSDLDYAVIRDIAYLHKFNTQYYYHIVDSNLIRIVFQHKEWKIERIRSFIQIKPKGIIGYITDPLGVTRHVEVLGIGAYGITQLFTQFMTLSNFKSYEHYDISIQ